MNISRGNSDQQFLEQINLKSIRLQKLSLSEQMKPPSPQAGATSTRHRRTQTGTAIRITPEAQSHAVNALALLDSGSLAGNFVNDKSF